ncbi:MULTISPECIES: hypothetical protein [Nitratireductor]|uniref:hypothetical protein n=1 Tax=Nitratireductor TaxID=245876 RepID=UPI0019D36C7E|nr:hypothetical protein [Nitratireductor aquibiodomus]MBN7763398.1 hypothetical protein [Nitratireductor aquibiodomus]
MENWLKALISAACVVVIAGGGYALWGGFSANRQVQQAAERADQAREEIFALAKAEPHQVDQVRFFCESVANGVQDDRRKRIARNCRELGYL